MAPSPPMVPGVALVTGAAKRIGRAIAKDLAAQGWAVAVHHRASGAEAAELVAEIQNHGGRAVALAADLAREAEMRTLLPAAEAALGPITLLVNNASVFEDDTIASATRESWDLHLEVNLRAPFVLTQDFAARLPENLSGAVINIIDQRVWNPTPRFVSYTLSKAGLWTLTQTLALALAPRIRVNAIGPGPTLPSPRQSEDQFVRQWSRLPLRRPVDPDEISRAVRFILAAPSLTGQMIALDAGQHLGWAHPAGAAEPEE